MLGEVVGVPAMSAPRPSLERRGSINFDGGPLASHAGEWAAFISHCKDDAAMDARWLQEKLEAHFVRRCFLDSDDLRDLTKIRRHVADADVLLLVQSANVLSRPYCLIELLAAIEAGRPIVGVSLTGHFAYDFGVAESFLEQLDSKLKLVNPGAEKLLASKGVDLADAAWKLSSVLPQIISIELNRNASRAILKATVADIVSAMGSAEALSPSDKEEWLRARSSGALRSRSGSLQHGARRGSGQRAASLLVPRHVPTLPESFDECFAAGSSRELIFGAVKSALLERPASTSLSGLRTVVMRGMGGVGKTTLAAAVARDADVGSAFEALAWLNIGQTPELPTLLRSLLRQFGGTPAEGASDEEVAEACRTAARGRKLLLVLDDCWEAEPERALNLLDERSSSACLVSSRLRGLVPRALEIDVTVLTLPESVALLLKSGGVEHLIADPPLAAVDVAELLSRAGEDAQRLKPGEGRCAVLRRAARELGRDIPRPQPAVESGGEEARVGLPRTTDVGEGALVPCDVIEPLDALLWREPRARSGSASQQSSSTRSSLRPRAAVRHASATSSSEAPSAGVPPN